MMSLLAMLISGAWAAAGESGTPVVDAAGWTRYGSTDRALTFALPPTSMNRPSAYAGSWGVAVQPWARRCAASLRRDPLSKWGNHCEGPVSGAAGAAECERAALIRRRSENRPTSKVQKARLGPETELHYFTCEDAFDRQRFFGIIGGLSFAGQLYLFESLAAVGVKSGPCSARESFDILTTLRRYEASELGERPRAKAAAPEAPKAVPLLR